MLTGSRMGQVPKMTGVGNQQRILLFLRRQGEASVAELAQGLGLTQVTIRHHLTDLMQTGLVSPPEKRHHGGPGRPEQVYALTAQAEPRLPGNYPELAQSLLAVLEARQGPEWVRRAMMASGAQAAGFFGLSSVRGSEAFVPEVLAALDQRGYLASAGTWSGRRCITFAHCPYLTAARAWPGVCAFDQSLVEGLFAEPVVLFRRIAEHDEQCMFLLGA